MKPLTRTILLCLGLTLSYGALASSAVNELLSTYRQQGASNFSAAAGKRFWNQTTHHAGSANAERSCASCHTSDLRQDGKHVVTGKTIKPMAPSITGRRLTNPKKINKWFRRNCLWTRGRECTAQEKGDVLTYLKDL